MHWPRWLLLLLLAVPWQGSAKVVQMPWLRPLGLTDGLPTQDVRAIAEDATGYVWLATADGLLRFDGQRFRTLHHEDGLPDPDLQDLHIDAQDRLWLATRTQGVVTFGVDRLTFERADAAAPAAVRGGHVRQVIGSPDGRIWVIGDDGRLYSRAGATPVWQRVELDDRAVTHLAVDHDGIPWVATATGMWHRSSDGFVPVPLPLRATPPWEGMWADPRGGMEVSTAGMSWRLDRDGNVLDGPRQGRTLHRGSDDVVWRQTEDGLVWQQQGRERRVGIRAGLPSPRPPHIRRVLRDRQGDLWWVGERTGLWWLPAHWRRFAALPAIGDTLDNTRLHPVAGLAAAGRNHVWVARADGPLQRLDLRTGKVAHEVVDVLARGAPVGLAEDASGALWLAGGDELVRYDPARRQVRRWRLESSAAPGMPGLQVCTRGQVWVAMGDTVHRFSPAGERLGTAPSAQWGLSAMNGMRQLLCTRDDTLWATDPSGLMRWMPERERFVRPDGQTEGAATAVAETADGALWVARQAALEKFRTGPDGLQALQRITRANGYPQLQANALVVDAAGVVWAGATRGLVRVAPKPGEVKVLGVAQGLPAQEVLPHRLVRLGSGAIVAAVREGGLLAFDPTTVPGPPVVPALVVDAMTRRHHGRMVPVPPGNGPVALSTADRNFRVAVSLLGRGDPDRIQHRFRLLGHDPEWVETGPVAQRIFARLPAGDQVLLIQARHAAGPWSAVRELQLRVMPVWWQTGAGRAAVATACVILLLLTGRLLHCRRQRRQRHRAAREELAMAELDSQERTRFLARLGRQIRTPMTPVLGWSELLLQSSLSPTQRIQIGSLHQAGHHLLQLIDDALDLARIEANRLQVASAPFELRALLDELHALLLPVAQSKALALEWCSSIAPERCYLGDVQRLRQVLLNLLGNALKFTARGQVGLAVREGESGQGLVMEITDTGPGMSRRQLDRLFQRFSQADGMLARHGGSGLGLAISRDLAEAMGGDIQVHSQPGHGTRLTVRLPWRTVAAPAVVAPVPVRRHSARSLRVMVLLPSASVTDVICALLRASGHRVVGVDDLETWLCCVDPGPWDLIAADPDMLVAGERLSARLPWLWPGVRRLALSPRADPCAERDALSAGFEVFLRLPLTGPRLDAALACCRAPP
jgi:signal transduction histidine kinase/ligand-binding sensor domain-containing protein